MNRNDSAMVIIDVQEKLVPAINDHQRIIWNITRLIQAAKELQVPIRLTEQYPRGLGHTVGQILAELPEANVSVPEKRMFSCRECEGLLADLQNRQIANLLVCGIESHVCVLQSVLDFISQGFNVFVPVDAIGSRNDVDHETALCRMELSGATLVTTEMSMFEWCETANAAEFKTISNIIKEPYSGDD